MERIGRVGVLMSVLLIAAAGCSSIEWLRGPSSKKEATSDQRREEERISPGSDRPDSQAASLPAPSRVASQSEAVHVLFAFNRWDLNGSAQTDLLSLVKRLKENPKLGVELEGYADSVGARDYNLQLSQKRVETVRRYLVEKGVEPSRIRSGGLGQLPDAGTAEERAKNRRVTVKLMLPKD